MLYRKKPIVIEAVQYEGNGNISESPQWIWEAFKSKVLRPTSGSDPLYIKTFEGSLLVKPNSYIIRGVKGELYPCEPEIFEQTYEKV